MSKDHLNEKMDEIIKQLDKPWIKSYSLFLHEINHIISERFDNQMLSVNNKTTAGMAIRILSTNNRMIERNLSISSIPNLDQLITQPKSTQSKIDVDNFHSIKKPRTGSILGDYSKNIEFNPSTIDSIFERSKSILSDYDMLFFEKYSGVMEERLITNQGSPRLYDSSLRTNYNISSKFEIRDVLYNLNRSISGRSNNLDLEKPTLSLVNSIIHRMKFKPVTAPDTPALILHPSIIGKLLLFHFYNSMINESIDPKIKWNKDYQLYDDPNAENGYYSTLFDDEGYLTKPKHMVVDGLLKETLVTGEMSNWKEGGNGYRMEWFQPQIRSYRYRISPHVSNLVLVGGSGKGNYFHNRPGNVILVRQGYSYTGLGSNNSDFVIHANEATYLRNGDIVGHIPNLTIYGNLNNILRTGTLSADKVQVIDSNLPGSVYIGWLVIGPNKVKIR